MRAPGTLRRILLAPVIAVAFTAGTALAQINVNISLAPPGPQFEAVPVMAPGYAWAPGYWGWHTDRYVWVRGRQIVERPGYRWEPDRWENRGGNYYRHAGTWSRDPGYRVVKVKKAKKEKHEGRGQGHGNGKGRGKHD